jgi:SNF2 family DNA or RNA helicase
VQTIHAIALIAANPSRTLNARSTLIIVPTSALIQWQMEIRDKSQLSVYAYHGSGRNSNSYLLNRCDVVLTTYGTVEAEAHCVLVNPSYISNARYDL